VRADEAARLGEALAGLRTGLEALELRALELNGGFVSAVAGAVEGGRWANLRELRLLADESLFGVALRSSKYALRAKGVRKLMKAVKAVGGLGALRVLALRVEGEALGEVFEALGLGLFPALEELGLPCCGLGDEGVQGLLEALEGRGAQLRGLDLRGNGITARGAGALSQALQAGLLPSLRSLTLADNPLSSYGAHEIVTAVHARALWRLRTLDLGNTGIDSPALQSLLFALCRRHNCLGCETLRLGMGIDDWTLQTPEADTPEGRRC
jgi:hypothetical protein